MGTLYREFFDNNIVEPEQEENRPKDQPMVIHLLEVNDQ